MPFDSAYILLNFAHDPAEFPSKSFVRSFRKFARFAKVAVLLLVLKGVSDAAVSTDRAVAPFHTIRIVITQVLD